MKKIDSITELPFYCGSNVRPDNGGMPELFPFDLFYDEGLGMFRQHSNPELEAHLKAIYESGSLVDGSISNESGVVYVAKLLDYISAAVDISSDIDILEVGFGSGLMLKGLKESGAKALSGIEPGKHRQVQGLEGIRLVEGFFPSSEINEEFDLIYSFLVLEHLTDPVKFLNQLANALKPGGTIIISVPNCEPNMEAGDISMFIHEHYSYFTRSSLTNVIKAANLYVKDISLLEGMIVATITSTTTVQNLDDFPEYSERGFYAKLNEHLLSLYQIFSKYNSEDVALYSPGRAVNSLHHLPGRNFRLVDDNTEMHKKYLPGLAMPIESFLELKSDPPKCILIYSRTFGERIKEKCLNTPELNKVPVYTLNDLEIMYTQSK